MTVTQVQALRAADAGFLVPKGTIQDAVQYIDRCCSTPEGGICYSLRNFGSGPRLAISCAAVATPVNPGEYDSPVATQVPGLRDSGVQDARRQPPMA